MKFLMATLALFTSVSAIAAPSTLVCEFSDSVATYRDIITLKDNDSATYEAQIAHLDGKDFQKYVWSDSLKVERNGDVLDLSGRITSVDGETADFQKSVNLATMETTSPWYGAYPCRWANSL